MGRVSVLVDVIDERPYLAAALQDLSETTPSLGIEIGTTVESWIGFSRVWDVHADVVVFCVELHDHVPAVLKARALSRLGVRSIAVVEQASAALERRLLAEGCGVVLSRDSGLEQLLAALRDVWLRPIVTALTDEQVLTDRELQVGALFCSRSAPSASRIGSLLGISAETVRVHLANCRKKMRLEGHDVSTRHLLREALIASGWLVCWL